MTETLEGWLEIGTIVAAQGLNGELRVYPESDFPERFEKPGQRWILYPNQTEPQPIELLKGRCVSGKNLYIVKFAGISDRDRADALRGCKLMVPESDRPILAEDEYHVLDLIGLEVFNQLTSETIGKVIDIIPAGNDLLVVSPQNLADSNLETEKPPKTNQAGKKTQEKQILIPFVKAIVPVVDLKAGRLEITPPPGLLEIN